MDGGLSVDSANESTILLTTNCGGADHGQDPGSLTTVPGDREHVPVAQEESPNLASVHCYLVLLPPYLLGCGEGRGVDAVSGGPRQSP